MLFNTVEFFVFLGVVLALFHLGPVGWRKPLLILASYFFYGWWNWRFIPLLAALTLIDYAAGLWMGRVARERRTLLLVASLAANLGFLGFFKYFNFFAANVGLRTLDLVLPVGISFHTLQSISYVVDVYRGQQKPVRSLVDYALFICFFPQLVSGPIVRARHFFGDLYAWRAPSPEEASEGALLIVLGLAKKMVFADLLSQVAGAYFRAPAAVPGILNAWGACLACALQVYFDFSGYTDIAIGSARLMGFHFPVNFRQPFLAASLSELWRRWHISFSSWLRDYVYIPLARRRKTEAGVCASLVLTMALGGLWHGANWTFVVWGTYHGVLLCVERLWRDWRRGRARRPARAWLWPFRVAATSLLFVMSAPLFRAAGLADAWTATRQLFSGPWGAFPIEPWMLVLLAAAWLLAWAEDRRAWFARLAVAPRWAYAAGMGTLLLLVELFGVTEKAVPFVYFQF
jgi:alginate O-acetyltransferase complex protein AlgI